MKKANKKPYGKGMKKKRWVSYSKHSTPLEVRFWSKVDIKGDNDCWLWLAGRTNSNYGSFGFNGTGVPAHRMAWLLTHTEIPEGMVIMHICDNGLCCNPNHMRLGTQKDNIVDMHNKKRGKNSKKTHCKYGHEFTLENTYFMTKSEGRVSRQCKTCAKLRPDNRKRKTKYNPQDKRWKTKEIICE